jgi:DNA-binding NarL/FixJ family response regulator
MFKYKLSMRELGISNLVRECLTNKEISGELFISLCTVETHLRNIFKKTKANNRAELVKLLDCCY